MGTSIPVQSHARTKPCAGPPAIPTSQPQKASKPQKARKCIQRTITISCVLYTQRHQLQTHTALTTCSGYRLNHPDTSILWVKRGWGGMERPTGCGPSKAWRQVGAPRAHLPKACTDWHDTGIGTDNACGIRRAVERQGAKSRGGCSLACPHPAAELSLAEANIPCLAAAFC